MATEAVTARVQPEPLHGVHVDPAGQIAFLDRHLLASAGGVVAEGGGSLKLIMGDPGAGKTHFLAACLAQAQARGFCVAHVDGRRQPLYGFDHLYRAVVGGLDLADLARRFVVGLLRREGYADPVLAPGITLHPWCQEADHPPERVRAKLGEALYRSLERNPDLDVAFGVGLSRWCEAVAWGMAPEDPMAEGLLERWLRGEKLAVRDCNRLRLRRPVDRYTARLWLRSLIHFVRQAGVPGLVVAVDGMGAVLAARRAPDPLQAGPGDGLASPTGGDVPPPYYTKQKRDDFYEMLRTLIDEMGLTPGFLLLLAGPPQLMEDDRNGIHSYVALAERLKTEVETVELNRFADTIVLERLWASDPGAGRTLAERLAEAVVPGADSGVRARAVAAALEQWQVRDVAVSAVRRSVLAALGAAGEGFAG